MLDYEKRSDLKGSLLGKKILFVRRVDGDQGVEFETDQGKVAWEVDADCCSHTWVENIDITLGTVTDVSDTDYGAREDVESYDVVQHYGLKITTDKGHMDIDFRNRSNGYYGGSMRVKFCQGWPEQE